MDDATHAFFSSPRYYKSLSPPRSLAHLAPSPFRSTMPSAKPANPLAPFYPDIGAPSTTYSTEGLEPLSYELDPAGDGKSVHNHPRPDGKLSPFYDKMWHGDGDPNSKPWADFHIYHQVSIDVGLITTNPAQQPQPRPVRSQTV